MARLRAVKFTLACFIAAVLLVSWYTGKPTFQRRSDQQLGSRSPIPSTHQDDEAALPAAVRSISDLESPDNFTAILTKRKLPKLTYAKALSRGKDLWTYLHDDTCAPTTPWTDFNRITTYGWTQTRDTDDIEYELANIIAVLPEIGLSTKGPPNMNVRWEHDRKVSVKNPDTHVVETYNPSGGYYDNVFNTQQGAIIADVNYSPEYEVDAGRQSPTPFAGGPLPNLRRWSDIIFLTWEKLAGAGTPQVKNLNTVIRQSIENADVINIILQALEKDGWDEGVPPWPGHVFTMDKEMSKALLGTDNGLGVAWLLIQHVEILGHKTVRGITVWDDQVRNEFRKNPNNLRPCMLFNVVPFQSLPFGWA